MACRMPYGQVGSKNAAFFMGRRIKVATKRADSPFVHELTIGAAELEERYRDAEVPALAQPCSTGTCTIACCPSANSPCKTCLRSISSSTGNLPHCLAYWGLPGCRSAHHG